LTENGCIPFCPDGTYPDTKTNSCLACASICKTCIDKNSCTSCPNQTYLFQNNCTLKCPNRTYFTDNTTYTCVPCDISCSSSCETSPLDCTDCKDGYYRPENGSLLCVNSCPYGTVKNSTSKTCSCSSTCLTCDGDLTYCTSCNSSLIFF
jgi:proprotein convertase subtilisin/kexin type 5